MAKGMPYLMMAKNKFYVVVGTDPEHDTPGYVRLFDNPDFAEDQRAAFWRMNLNAEVYPVEVQRA